MADAFLHLILSGGFSLVRRLGSACCWKGGPERDFAMAASGRGRAQIANAITRDPIAVDDPAREHLARLLLTLDEQLRMISLR